MTMTESVSPGGALDRIRRTVDVLDSYMTYLDTATDAGAGPDLGSDVGQRPVMLFLHGNPTSSFLWRNVIPHVAGQARCVAPDLIGMGRSGKPDIEYRFADQARYLDAFIDALGLSDVTLVLHDWGSALGFHYANRNRDNVVGVAFMEAIVGPISWESMPSDFADLFRAFRDPDQGRTALIEGNAFIEQVLPQAVVRPLTPAEVTEYRRPFLRAVDREPVWRFPNELPIDGVPADVHAAVADYAAWLGESQIPKLLLAAAPGALIPPAFADALVSMLPRLSKVDVGAGVHYVQEDAPDEIGRAIALWHSREVLGRSPATP